MRIGSTKHDWRDIEGDDDSQRCYRCGMTRTSTKWWRGERVWTMGYSRVRYKAKGGAVFYATYVPPCGGDAEAKK